MTTSCRPKTDRKLTEIHSSVVSVSNSESKHLLDRFAHRDSGFHRWLLGLLSRFYRYGAFLPSATRPCWGTPLAFVSPLHPTTGKPVSSSAEKMLKFLLTLVQRPELGFHVLHPAEPARGYGETKEYHLKPPEYHLFEASVLQLQLPNQEDVISALHHRSEEALLSLVLAESSKLHMTFCRKRVLSFPMDYLDFRVESNNNCSASREATNDAKITNQNPSVQQAIDYVMSSIDNIRLIGDQQPIRNKFCRQANFHQSNCSALDFRSVQNQPGSLEISEGFISIERYHDFTIEVFADVFEVDGGRGSESRPLDG